MPNAIGRRRAELKDEDYVAAYERGRGVLARAQEILGVHYSAIKSRLRRMKRDGTYDFEAARDRFLAQDREQTIRAMPLKGTSTLLGPDGEIKLQWVKTERGPVDPETLAKIVKDTFVDATPVRRVPEPRGYHAKHLLTAYPIGDHHVAMHAWHEETGENYDLKIAEQLLTTAAASLVERAPPSEVGLVVNLGDFFHVDNSEAVTTRSGNNLDVDGRYAKMIRTGIRIMRACIDTALAKHKRVRVINAIGNHDDIGSLWLSLALSLLYERNPRIEIDCSPAKFHYHQHGKVLIGVTHGDTVKLEQLPGIMAADQSDLWGQTKHRYWLTGHIHQRKVLEFAGCMVESFRTLAAKDGWAAGQGYRSGRDMTSITFDAEHGEVERCRFDAGMLRSAA